MKGLIVFCDYKNHHVFSCNSIFSQQWLRKRDASVECNPWGNLRGWQKQQGHAKCPSMERPAVLLMPMAPSLVVKCILCGGVVGMGSVRCQFLWEAYVGWLLFTTLVSSEQNITNPLREERKSLKDGFFSWTPEQWQITFIRDATENLSLCKLLTQCLPRSMLSCKIKPH